MPTRIPTEDDFAHLPSACGLHVSLVFPSVPETTTAIMLLFHGLGDSEASFATFARNLNLPGVLAVAVRGVSPLPPSMLTPSGARSTTSPTRNFHWGDDLALDPTTGDLDRDPGFAGASRLVRDHLITGVLADRCGWCPADILLFGYGQGGSLAVGLAAKLRDDRRVVDVTSSSSTSGRENEAFKGVISIGGPLPPSMVSTVSSRAKGRTPVLACHGRASEGLDDDAMALLRREFADVREVRWKKPDDGMPASREEVMPIMQFLAERLRDGW